MSRARRVPTANWTKARHYAGANCTTEEYALIRRLAARDALSVSDFIRRCINGYLLEEGSDEELLIEAHRSEGDQT